LDSSAASAPRQQAREHRRATTELNDDHRNSRTPVTIFVIPICKPSAIRIPQSAIGLRAKPALRAMGLDPVKRRLDDIAGEFLAPFRDGRFDTRSWRLINWDAEQGLCLTFESGGSCILVELEERNDRLDCYARTARFNVCVRRQFEDVPLSEADRAFVDSVIALVRTREPMLLDLERPAAGRKTIVREVLVDRLLMREGKHQYYINPYVGCMIACPFCYVIDRADFTRRLEGLPQLPWGHYLDVKINAAEVLRRETRSVTSGVVRMSPILTDPYQPAERRYRITRQCLEVLLDTDLAPVVLTRAPRILDDIELLKRFPRALVGFSIPTDADEYRRIFEPGADPIPQRFDALRALHAAGLGTFAVIQPVLPMNVDRLVENVAPFVRAVRLDRLYVVERVKDIYDRHGLGEFATEQFADETIRRLTEAFRSHGVQVDPLDNLEPLLGS
jgi:DNA repair photolyase